MAAAPARSIDRTGAILMLVVCLSLGINQVAAKIALADIPPLVQAAVRSGVATVILGGIAWWREPRLFASDTTLWPGLLIGVAFALEFIALFLGLQWTSASHAVLFLYTAPFFVAAGLKAFVPDERLNRLQWAGLVLSFVGIILALRSSGRAPDGVLLGDLFCLAGGGFWGVTTLLAKGTSLRSAPPIKILLYQLAVSAVVIAATAMALGEKWPLHLPAIAAASMAYQTFWVACLTFLLWFWLLRRYRAGELSSFTFLTPLVGVFTGWFVLHDRIDAGFLLALALVTAGICLVNWPAKKG